MYRSGQLHPGHIPSTVGQAGSVPVSDELGQQVVEIHVQLIGVYCLAKVGWLLGGGSGCSQAGNKLLQPALLPFAVGFGGLQQCWVVSTGVFDCLQVVE